MSGQIYFIAAVLVEGKSGAVKIGYSSGDPRKRLKALQTGHPDKLYLLHSIPGTMDDEHDLHRRFDRLRLRGEWFRYEDELHEYVWGLLQQQWEKDKELFGIVE